VIRDREALAELFEDGAVLATEDSSRGARGGDEIARLTHYLWEHNHTYLAEPSPVLQAGDTGLIVAKRGINVVRRGTDPDRCDRHHQSHHRLPGLEPAGTVRRRSRRGRGNDPRLLRCGPAAPKPSPQAKEANGNVDIAEHEVHCCAPELVAS
jgi:hypothetical protein